MMIFTEQLELKTLTESTFTHAAQLGTKLILVDGAHLTVYDIETG
jgi:hypothetical protein